MRYFGTFLDIINNATNTFGPNLNWQPSEHEAQAVNTTILWSRISVDTADISLLVKTFTPEKTMKAQKGEGVVEVQIYTFFIIIIIIIIITTITLWGLRLFQGHGLPFAGSRGNWHFTKRWWEPHARSTAWRARVSLFARHLAVNLYGMAPPAARLSPAQQRSQCGVLRRQMFCKESIAGYCYRLAHCDCCKVPNLREWNK